MVNVGKVIVRLVCFVSMAALALAVAFLFSETGRLRRQIQHMEDERDQAVIAEFRRDWRSLPEDEKARIVGIYKEVAQAYANRDAVAMYMSMLKLPHVNNQQTWQWGPDVDRSFNTAFKRAFLLAEKLLDFDSPEQFTEYVELNIAAAIFLGNAYARQRSFEFSANVECNTLQRLKQYEAKFDKDGKTELKAIATKALSFWIAWIESPNGFTRQYAHWLIFANFEYARLVKPELALTRENAMKGAYTCAKLFLSKSGYTPSWLSEFQVKEDKDATTSGSAGK